VPVASNSRPLGHSLRASRCHAQSAGTCDVAPYKRNALRDYIAQEQVKSKPSNCRSRRIGLSQINSRQGAISMHEITKSHKTDYPPLFSDWADSVHKPATHAGNDEARYTCNAEFHQQPFVDERLLRFEARRTDEKFTESSIQQKRN
jgi:hypothetical protein